MFPSVNGVELPVIEGDVSDTLGIRAYGPPGARLPRTAADGDEAVTLHRDVVCLGGNGGDGAALGVGR
jgi:hypothetical protein